MEALGMSWPKAEGLISGGRMQISDTRFAKRLPHAEHPLPFDLGRVGP
jgi:hypothetical protein